ncbi:hypothetical protein WG66_012954 [Moniliophthora roreri]|nr:hypothetical protein WG66_012954 [Moniliophthora roreri]
MGVLRIEVPCCIRTVVLVEKLLIVTFICNIPLHDNDDRDPICSLRAQLSLFCIEAENDLV